VFFALTFCSRASARRTERTQCPEIGAQSPEKFPKWFTPCSRCAGLCEMNSRRRILSPR